MKRLECLNFYLTKDEKKMILTAGEENNRLLSAVYYLCCDVKEINLNDFISILSVYKNNHPGTDVMYYALINKIFSILKRICKKRLNMIYGGKSENAI